MYFIHLEYVYVVPGRALGQQFFFIVYSIGLPIHADTFSVCLFSRLVFTKLEILVIIFRFIILSLYEFIFFFPLVVFELV